MRASPLSSYLAVRTPTFSSLLIMALGWFVSTPSLAQESIPTLLWEIGTVDGPPETLWSEVGDAAIHNRWVYVSDVALSSVRRYSLDGRYDRDIARRGQGPGEVLYPTTITAVRDDILVYDSRQGRISYFDSVGNHVRTVRPQELPRFLKRLWLLRDGWYAGTTNLVGTLHPAESQTDHYFLLWKSGMAPDTLAAIPGASLWMKVRGMDWATMVTKHALGPDGDVWVLGDSALVAVEGSTSTATIWSVDSGGPHVIRQKLLPAAPPRRIAEEEREAIISWHIGLFGLDEPDPRIDHYVLPEYWPRWTRVRDDGQGNVWVRRGGPARVDPSKGEIWLRWSPQSDTFDEIAFPPRVEVLQFNGRYAVGVRRDELGVEFVQLYDVAEAR